MERPIPSKAEVISYIRDRSNWGRWGKDDEVGTVNLITAQKRVTAAGLVRSGRTVSLSRDFPTKIGAGNPIPAQHWVRSVPFSVGGNAEDYYGTVYHGYAFTHIDALCHVWDDQGMYNGRDPEKEVSSMGAKFGGVEAWSDGIVTRGVLLDVPKYRGQPYVTHDRPVHGWELEEAAQAQGVTIEPGDAVAVYCGREEWQKDHSDTPYGLPERHKEGLHASCLPFIRDHDLSLLAWDMHDHTPSDYEGLYPFSVHMSVFAYGLALLDNALLQPLAEACGEEGRYEFMLMVSPLKIAGGTGSPVNPIAMF